MGELARVAGVATATPRTAYTQQELLDIYRIQDEKIVSLFRNSAIDRRFLELAPVGPDGVPQAESQGELLAKHARAGVELGERVVYDCLDRIGARLEDVRYLVCVTTTGFLTPGLSAMLVDRLHLPPTTGRLDVVGMGCNAGLNGLTAASNWAKANPGELALLVCAEVCSAAYVFDGTMRTAVVNSLFGDGAAAVGLVAGRARGPELLRHASRMIPEAIGAMRYDWDGDAGKFSFYLDRDIPYVVGAHAEEAVDRLLAGTGLRRSEIAHWVVHSGGKKVIDSVTVNLGLTRHDLRHTTDVLRNYGNLSSASFLFSYERLLEEKVTVPGDHVVFMTMGPGSQIETALARF